MGKGKNMKAKLMPPKQFDTIPNIPEKVETSNFEKNMNN